MRRLLGVLGALLVLVPLLGSCGVLGGDPKEEYCAAVRDHQKELSDIVGSGDQAALIHALGIFKDLQGKAPDDITDEWQQVVGRIEALQEALEEAHVDPETYNRKHPPAGLTSEQKARIDAAAEQLGSGTTLRALEDLDQQARDVCQTPLTL